MIVTLINGIQVLIKNAHGIVIPNWYIEDVVKVDNSGTRYTKIYTKDTVFYVKDENIGSITEEK